MIKLVLSDVDGTIIPLGAGHVDPRLIESIRRLQETDVLFGLCTGRDVNELHNMLDGFDDAFSTGILSNGQKIMANGRLARLTLHDITALERVADVVACYEGTFITLYPYHGDAQNSVYCVNADPEQMRRCAEKYSFTAIPVDRIPHVEAIGSTIACDQDQSVLDEIKERAALVCPELDFVQPSEHWCDIVPAGLNKGTALPMLLDELGISTDEVVVFGDAENDLSVLNAVEHSVAVSNAMPAVLKAARWHIGSCEDCAVADALDSIAEVAGTTRLPAFMSVAKGRVAKG